jgi:GNAT superfamily N-acetyltransferase
MLCPYTDTGKMPVPRYGGREERKMERECSVAAGLVIEKASREAYEKLSGWHYRGRRIGPYTAIYGAREKGSRQWAGVIVYGMPQIGNESRAKAMVRISQESDGAGIWSAGSGLAERIRWLNANVRCILRVIVDPRYRGIGLGVRLVRETLGLVGVPVIEALAVMGEVNPFFERAGMMRFDGKVPTRCLRMTEAFELVGIGRERLIDPRTVHGELEALPPTVRLFIEAEMRLFLKPYVKKRNMSHSFERTRFILSRLGARPVYYIYIKNQKAKRQSRNQKDKRRRADTRVCPYKRRWCDQSSLR